MSQRITDAFLSETGPPERLAPEEHDLAVIQRYLAVLEENKKACCAAVTDADMAMDMAGFVRRQLRNPQQRHSIPHTLLALALVQRVPDAPQQ